MQGAPLLTQLPETVERRNPLTGQLEEVRASLGEACGLDELVPYKLSVGNAFLVTGSASGRTENIKETMDPLGVTGTCEVDVAPGRLPEVVARIPMTAPTCDSNVIDPATLPGSLDMTFRSEKRPTVGQNPCLVGPRIEGPDMMPTRDDTIYAVFQNAELRFVLAGLERKFTDTLQIRFDVHGGFAAQSVTSAQDVGVGLPVRLQVGPVSAIRQGNPYTQNPWLDEAGTGDDPAIFGPDMPFLFVVDQRVLLSTGRLGPRGQIVRINPRVNDIVPGFEGPSASNRYFPIQ